MSAFASWLSDTSLSQAIQTTLWLIPALQSIHLIAIGVLFACAFMISARILYWAAREQDTEEVARRCMPLFWLGLGGLAATGLLLVIGEPARQLLSLSFWLKMTLVALGVATLVAFRRRLLAGGSGKDALIGRPAIQAYAAANLGLWCAVVVLGRLIAWDAQIWGSLSPQF